MTETPHTLDKVAIRMVKEPPLYSSTPVRSPDDAVRLMAEMLKGYDREVFCIVNFRNDMTPINMNIVSMGTLNASLVHPLTIAYWVNRIHASGINYFGNTIKYELVPDGKDDLPPDAKSAVGVHCATYAKYDLMPEDEFIRYEFDGWYYDKGLKKKVPDTIMVAEDHTFYGTYHKVAGLITTEVVNGAITDGNECVPYGTDYNIDYAPKDGYLLDTVTVDGKPADDPKTDDGTPSDDPKTEDTTPKDDDKTPADDTKKQDDQKPVITPTETDDKKDTTTPTQDSSKFDDDTKKTTVKDNTESNDDSGKGQSTPGSDGKGQSTQTTAPKTGDEANVTLWVVLMQTALVMKAIRGREGSQPLPAPGKRIRMNAVRQMIQMKTLKKTWMGRKEVSMRIRKTGPNPTIKGLRICQSRWICRKSTLRHCRQ